MSCKLTIMATVAVLGLGLFAATDADARGHGGGGFGGGRGFGASHARISHGHVHRAKVGTVYSSPASNDVYVGGELVGRDPDPSIRAFMMRNPHIWDGPE